MFPNGRTEGYSPGECEQPVTLQTLHCSLQQNMLQLKRRSPEMAKAAKENKC